MKPKAFRYHRPADKADALRMLAEEDEDARPLAGGQSLVPLMNLRFAAPSALIDLNGCADLATITVADGVLELGAMVRQRDAELSPVVIEACPLVAEALALNGHPATRHRGTVGGTIAHADPVAELSGVAVALDAEVVIERQGGRRTVPAADFFLDALTTVVEPGEMVTAVRFPVLAPGTATAFVETGMRGHGLAVAGIAAALRIAGGRIDWVRLAAIGVSPVPVRLAALEDALAGRSLGEVESAVASVADPLGDADLLDNLEGSSAYRRELVPTLVARAVRVAADKMGVAA
ncbi:FAD binding domain-containing protein [Acuticoccus kandeliae]|uniref:FAD binding domain-containing protein n=1 Tax=Acuticoccus kandeliae TaxID=2073160 RepID=UPI000D3E2542|nr:xanthine dehydrogenase family protein subunit M [Acuticoccus kandeliae]